MKLSLYATREDAVPVPAAKDGNEIGGIPQDTCDYVPGLLLYFRNNSSHPHSISINKTVRQGEVAKPYDVYQVVLSAGAEGGQLLPAEAYFGPFDTFVPTEDLSELGVEEGEVQVQYLSGTDGLFVAAIGVTH